MHTLLVGVGENQGWHELFTLAGFVLPIHSRRWRIFANFTATKNDCVPGFFRAIPPPVAIHRKISADDRNDLGAALRKFLFARFQKAGPAGGRSVTAVRESMDKDLDRKSTRLNSSHRT